MEKQKTPVALWVCLVSTILLSSCSLIEKSRDARNGSTSNDASGPSTDKKPRVQVTRSYVDLGNADVKNSQYNEETTRLAYELGLDPKFQLSKTDLDNIQKRRQVRVMERRLETTKEREQYSKVLPLMKDDDEKIAFLNIPSLEGRQVWVNKTGVMKRAKSPTTEMREAMETQDITMDMPMDLVKKAWGEPNSVDVSGNPLYRNERWKYLRYVSTPDGYKPEKRYVYFEGGKVVGWETE